MGKKQDWSLSDTIADEEDPVLTLTDIGWDEAALDDAEIATIPLNEDLQAVRALLADAEAQCERALPIGFYRSLIRCWSGAAREASY